MISPRFLNSLVIVLIATIFACSVPQTKIHRSGKEFLCGNAEERVLVLWGTAWRLDQKEREDRRQKASQGITDFFAHQKCFSSVEIRPEISGEEPMLLSDTEISRLASTNENAVDTVILIRVEELGPLLIFYLSPILWEGGSEVVVSIRVLDLKTQQLVAHTHVQRRDTGAFILRGTGNLSQDLEKLLEDVFKRKPLIMELLPYY